MADQEKEILEEEMEQDLSDAEELKEEETERNNSIASSCFFNSGIAKK